MKEKVHSFDSFRRLEKNLKNFSYKKAAFFVAILGCLDASAGTTGDDGFIIKSDPTSAKTITKNDLAVVRDENNINLLHFKYLDHRVSGTVSDVNGSPLSGVSVKIKGKPIGTVTDENGKFELNVPDNAILEISLVGYGTKEITVGNQNSISVQLEASVSQLDEVVVVGYGTQKKANLTGAVDQVGSEVFENRPMPNITQGLQGAMPNLNITLADGKPYRDADYQIRGTGSVGQGGSALILIDGVEGDPSSLNPNDIASVSILKDASSAAIYGARGSFGVVLITTKNPNKGRASITYNGNLSVKSPTIVPDLVTDPILYTDMFVEAYSSYYDYARTPVAFHTALPYSQDWYNELKKHTPGSGLPDVMVDDKGNYQYYGSTDWMGLLYKKQLLQHDHNITLQGGNEKTTFLVSGRYYDQAGLFRYNSDDFNGANIRAKGSAQIFDWLNVDNNFSYSNGRYFFPTTVSNGTVWYSMGSDSQPMSVMFNPDGTLTQGAAYGVGDLWYGKSGINTKKKTLRNTTSFRTSFFDDQFRVRGDFTFLNTDLNELTKRVPVPFSSKEGVISYIGAATNDLTETNQRSNYLAANLYMEYEKSFSDAHYFKGLLGYNYEQSSFDALSSFRNGLIFPDAQSLSLASGGSVKIDNDYNKWRIAGSFFRFNYSYKDRYLLEINGRVDGSSKFPENEQIGFFPSLSAAWRLTEESFWKADPKGISNIKIRGSYGSLGNGNVSPYAFMELYNIQTMSRLISGNLQQATSVPPVIPDGLTWETATTGNIGLDLGFLDNRLEFTGDAYVRKTKNMFATGIDLPGVFGAAAPRGNYADMTTRGWEISLHWRDQVNLSQKPFRYGIKVTLADHKSVIDKYTNEDKNLGALNNPNTPYYEGMTLGEIWGFETEGFFTSQDDIDKHVKQNRFSASSTKTWLPGDIKFKNLNNDDEISSGENRVGNPGDRKIIGNQTPRYAFSINLNGEWNGFFASFFFQGIGKQDWWPGNDNLYFWGQYNRPYNLIPKSMIGNIWTEDNPNAYYPRYRGYVALQGSDRELSVVQSRYLQNVAYIRLKNFQIGYNFTSKWVKTLRMQAARVYITGENLWSASPMYKHTKDIDVAGIYGPDREATASSDIEGGKDDHIGGGANVYNYPILKSIGFGLSLTF